MLDLTLQKPLVYFNILIYEINRCILFIKHVCWLLVMFLRCKNLDKKSCESPNNLNFALKILQKYTIIA